MRRGLLALVLGLVATPVARAHDLADPRVLVVVVSKDKIELRVNEMTPVSESEVLRRRFDGDRSGTLDDSELSDLASFLAVRATRSLKIEESGAALPLRHADRVLRNAGTRVDATQPLSVDVVLEARPTGRDEITVVLRDEYDDAHPVKTAAMARGVTFVSASAGDLDAKRGLLSGALLDRTHALTLRYR